MTRKAIPMLVPDVSAFARNLKAELERAPEADLGHQRLLNLVARAGGFRNYQQLRATCTPAPAPNPVDGRLVARVLARFDDEGRLTGWASRRKIRQYCLWALWAQVPARTDFSEREISQLFDTMTTFRDPAQIRRSLLEDRLLERERDGSRYRRIESRPDVSAQAIIRTITALRGTGHKSL